MGGFGGGCRVGCGGVGLVRVLKPPKITRDLLEGIGRRVMVSSDVELVGESPS